MTAVAAISIRHRRATVNMRVISGARAAARPTSGLACFFAVTLIPVRGQAVKACPDASLSKFFFDLARSLHDARPEGLIRMVNRK
jgi:hypothetical protein